MTIGERVDPSVSATMLDLRPDRQCRLRLADLSRLYWLFGELVWIRELSAVRSMALFPQYAHAYSLLVLAFLGWYNHQVRPQRLRLWERFFMRDRCGNVFRPLEQQEAA